MASERPRPFGATFRRALHCLNSTSLGARGRIGLRRKRAKTVRILHISHGHPAIIAGGAEIASFELFRRMVQLGYDAYYLARVGPPTHIRHPGTPFQALAGRDREILFYADRFDNFLLSQREETAITLHFREFLEDLRPDVVHFTHFVYLGVETIRQVHNVLPDAGIACTLHEFLPICASDGRMVRTTDRGLCEYSSPLRCHQCFRDRTPQDFLLRELFIKSHLELVDMFIAPSRFLLERYRQWGLHEDKLRYLDNGRVVQDEVPARVTAPGDRRGQFAYFGQLNPDKGLPVLLAAMKILAERKASGIHLSIYGANLDKQSANFQEAFKSQVVQCGNNVAVFPEYSQAELPLLMKNVDWVVVPSTWWENAPLTIQEAFMHRRPVICSDVGGMAEKVRDNVDGLHFRVNDPISLADTLLRASRNEELWGRLRDAISPVFAVNDAAAAHIAVYESLRSMRTPTSDRSSCR